MDFLLKNSDTILEITLLAAFILALAIAFTVFYDDDDNTKFS